MVIDGFGGSELDVRSAVVGDWVQFRSISKALSVLIDDRCKADAWTVVADGDGGVAKVTRSFVAGCVVAEGVVRADFAGAFEEEKFFAERVVGEVADVLKIEAEAVDGLHAKGGVFAAMIGVFDPTGELGIELFEGGDVTEIANEELIPDGAEEALNFAFGGTIPNGCMNEDGPESGTDESKFLGNIV